MRAKAVVLGVVVAMAAGSTAWAHEPGELGVLRLGPRVGAGLGISGPRGGYLVGLELRYQSPRYFYYGLEASFLHLVPRGIDVDETEGSGTPPLAPSHEVTMTGLYGVPITFEVGLRLPLNRIALRAGVAIGAMISVQTMESLGQDQQEVVGSFCFRPTLGIDFLVGDSGLVRLDVAYLWQDAEFELTGNDRDVDTVLVSVGYSWLLFQ